MKKNENIESVCEEILQAEEDAWGEEGFRDVEIAACRLKHHLMPPAGWMNDPNGLCFYRGRYHVFFQYSPQDVYGGLKCWGHYVSEDLVHWDYLGIPLLPDTPWDKDGVYSGSALTDDGLLELFYTGNTKEEGNHDYILSGRGANILYVSCVDGVNFGKKKLLLTNADYPDGYTCHIRDPKVWKENGIYYMILGGRRIENKGAALIYRSDDKKNWEFLKEVTTGEPFGYMWECPDLFELGKRTVLSVCPQGLKREEFRFQNVHQAGYFLFENSLGRGDAEGISPEIENLTAPSGFQEWDMGFDFYAPQTFLDEKGRRILLAWAGVPDMEEEYKNDPSIAEGWQHSMTMFRELTVKNGRILQNPLEEYKQLRREKLAWEAGRPLEFDSCAEIAIQFDPGDKGKKGIRLGDSLEFYFVNGTIQMKFLDDSGWGRNERKAKAECIENIRVFVDSSMLEIYVNMGEFVFTTRYFMRDNKRKIFISGHVDRVQAWTLNPIITIKNKQEENR